MEAKTEAGARELIQEAMTLVCDRSENWLGDAGALPAETRIEDLGLDSVATLEVIGVMEDRIGSEFPDEEIVRITTLGDLIALIQQEAV